MPLPAETWYYEDQNGIVYTLVDHIYTFLVRADGTDGPDVEVAGDRYPYQQGEKFRAGGIYAPPIEIILTVNAAHNSRAEFVAWLDSYLRALNPFKNTSTLGALIRQRADRVTRAIDVLISGRPVVEMTSLVSANIGLRFRAPYPFWYNPTENEEIFALSGPAGITFPITFPTIFGASDIDSTANVLNAGDLATWPRVRVYGPGTNPTVDNNTTGKVMEIAQTLDVNDYVEIDMEEADVWFYDSSAGTLTRINDKISAASEFWQLQPGGNEIHVTLGSTTVGSIRLVFRTWYTKS